MAILVVDDDLDMQTLLKRYLAELNLPLYLANHGEQAVELYRQHQPQLILMDVAMPIMDGFAAAHSIRHYQNPKSECAILFMTALETEELLVHCLECGGDDIITKPFRRALLLARTKSWLKRTQLAIQLREHRDRLAYERRFVENTLERIRHSSRLDEHNLRFLLDSVERAAGDILLAASRPDGVQHIFLGDFTGHGLPAALGAPLVSDIFYSMTQRGCVLSHILMEINQKLHDRLPSGMFLAMAACEADHGRGVVKLWNAGLPDILVYEQDRVCFRAPSSLIPLGITVDENFLAVGYYYQSRQPKRIFLYTDGVTEMQNSEGQFFGQQTLERVISQIIAFNEPLSMVQHFLRAYRGHSSQLDDASMAELFCDPTLPSIMHRPPHPHLLDTQVEESDWSLELTFGPDALNTMDLIPQVMSILAIRHNLRQHYSRLFTIVGELITNAIDWGILQLPPCPQKNRNGENYHLKSKLSAMRRLDNGTLHIVIRHQHGMVETHETSLYHGAVIIQVSDSGPGFSSPRPPLDGHCGLALVNRLCHSLSFSQKGNQVEAIYHY
ncbi:SpoIIE family protein phosphatase [Magnetococcus marinus]|nr:SpoIIE family protein phosphatase [Magnetococcus marinus]